MQFDHGLEPNVVGGAKEEDAGGGIGNTQNLLMNAVTGGPFSYL